MDKLEVGNRYKCIFSGEYFSVVFKENSSNSSLKFNYIAISDNGICYKFTNKGRGYRNSMPRYNAALIQLDVNNPTNAHYQLRDLKAFLKG